MFETVYLWTVEGRLRSHSASGSWSNRTVVVVGDSFLHVSGIAEQALLSGWSSAPHQVIVTAVRPSTVEDLEMFKYSTDDAFRVKAPLDIDDET